MEGHYQRMTTHRTQVTYTGLCHSLGMACYNYLKTGLVLASTAISYTSGEVFASSGSPTCIGYAHPTRAAQNSWQKKKKDEEINL